MMSNPYVKAAAETATSQQVVGNYWIEDRRTKNFSHVRPDLLQPFLQILNVSYDRCCLFRSLALRTGSGCWSRFAGAKPAAFTSCKSRSDTVTIQSHLSADRLPCCGCQARPSSHGFARPPPWMQGNEHPDLALAITTPPHGLSEYFAGGICSDFGFQISQTQKDALHSLLSSRFSTVVLHIQGCIQFCQSLTFGIVKLCFLRERFIQPPPWLLPADCRDYSTAHWHRSKLLKECLQGHCPVG